MEGSTARILVVEDYEPFRRFFCSTLAKRADLQIVGEALDGLEAVQKAEELQPDLIVLDLGLPMLNGIEAARQIRKLSPKSKIIFVTLESSADLVQEAFSLGALGYVIKTRAGTDLLAAVQAGEFAEVEIRYVLNHGSAWSCSRVAPCLSSRGGLSVTLITTCVN